MIARTIPAALLLLPAAAYSGVTATMSEKEKTNTFFIEGNRLRMEQGNRIMIFDGDEGRLITIDQVGRTYGVSTEADMKALGAKYRTQMQAASEQMRKQMEKMPPEQRKQMQEMLDRAGSSGGEPPPMEPPKVETRYEPTGAKRTVAGYSCQMYRVVERGSSGEEQCLIPWSAGVVKKDDLEVFKSFARFMSQTLVGMGRAAPRDAGEGALRDLTRGPGVPALRLQDGKVVSELKKLERGSVSADKFAVPAGYRKVGPANLGGPEGE